MNPQSPDNLPPVTYRPQEEQGLLPAETATSADDDKMLNAINETNSRLLKKLTDEPQWKDSESIYQMPLGGNESEKYSVDPRDINNHNQN